MKTMIVLLASLLTASFAVAEELENEMALGRVTSANCNVVSSSDFYIQSFLNKGGKYRLQFTTTATTFKLLPYLNGASSGIPLSYGTAVNSLTPTNAILKSVPGQLSATLSTQAVGGRYNGQYVTVRAGVGQTVDNVSCLVN